MDDAVLRLLARGEMLAEDGQHVAFSGRTSALHDRDAEVAGGAGQAVEKRPGQTPAPVVLGDLEGHLGGAWTAGPHEDAVPDHLPGGGHGDQAQRSGFVSVAQWAAAERSVAPVKKRRRLDSTER